MAQSLALKNSELYRAVAIVLGVSRDLNDWDATTLEDVRTILKSGLRKFYNPPPIDGAVHQWRFLERSFIAPAEAAVSTGTVAVSSGTVTLTGSTWPSWAADAVLRVDGHTLYITAVTSTTVLTVSNTALTVAAGTTYTMNRWRYPLASDFGEFIGGVTYDRGNFRSWKLRGVVDSEIKLRYAANYRTGETSIYSVVPGGPDSSDDDDWYFTLWPTMDAESVIRGVYRSMPTVDIDDQDAVQISGVHADTLMSAVQAAAEEFYQDAPGVHAERFLSRLAASILHDRHSQGVADFGDYPPGADPRKLALLYHTPTYNDTI